VDPMKNPQNILSTCFFAIEFAGCRIF